MSADGVQKRVSDPMELKLQAVWSRLTWVLGTNLESPARAVSALKHGAIFPALLVINFIRTLYLGGFWSLTMKQGDISPQIPHLMHVSPHGHLFSVSSACPGVSSLGLLKLLLIQDWFVFS